MAETYGDIPSSGNSGGGSDGDQVFGSRAGRVVDDGAVPGGSGISSRGSRGGPARGSKRAPREADGRTSSTSSMRDMCEEFMSFVKEDSRLRNRVVDLLEGSDAASTQRASFIQFLNSMLPSMTEDVFLHFVSQVTEYATRCVQLSGRRGSRRDQQTTSGPSEGPAQPTDETNGAGPTSPGRQQWAEEDVMFSDDDEDGAREDLVRRLEPSQVLTLPQGGRLQRVEAVHRGPDGNVVGTSQAPPPLVMGPPRGPPIASQSSRHTSVQPQGTAVPGPIGPMSRLLGTSGALSRPRGPSQDLTRSPEKFQAQYHHFAARLPFNDRTGTGFPPIPTSTVTTDSSSGEDLTFANLTPVSMSSLSQPAPGSFGNMSVGGAVGTVMQDPLLSPPGLEAPTEGTDFMGYQPTNPHVAQDAEQLNTPEGPTLDSDDEAGSSTR